jgi:hypothetical protein
MIHSELKKVFLTRSAAKLQTVVTVILEPIRRSYGETVLPDGYYHHFSRLFLLGSEFDVYGEVAGAQARSDMEINLDPRTRVVFELKVLGPVSGQGPEKRAEAARGMSPRGREMSHGEGFRALRREPG